MVDVWVIQVLQILQLHLVYSEMSHVWGSAVAAIVKHLQGPFRACEQSGPGSAEKGPLA